jgi:hypothetical protein
MDNDADTDEGKQRSAAGLACSGGTRLASAPVPSRLQGAQATLGRNILETSSPSSPSPSTYQSCPSSPPLGYHRAELKATYASFFAVAQKGEWDICTSITSQVC